MVRGMPSYHEAARLGRAGASWLVITGMVGMLLSHSLPARAMPTMDEIKLAPESTRGTPKVHLAAFGTLEVRTNANLDNGQWRALLARSELETVDYKACLSNERVCHPRLRAWRKFVSRVRGLAGIALLNEVNARINDLVVYGDDAAVYREKDHWATPSETLTRQGDCEDYAILKYSSLAELGVSEHSMKIIVVKNKARNIAHAVVAVEMDGKTWILDNLRSRAVVDSSINHYQALYSVNRHGMWMNLTVRPVKSQLLAEQQISEPATRSRNYPPPM